jgi:hypothetical protein
MASPNIKHKRSSVASKVPTSGQLPVGELAINTADGVVYLQKDDTTIVKVGGDTVEATVVDDISSGFNGVTTTFDIDVSAVNLTNSDINSQIGNLLISVGGVLQEPDTGGSTGFNIGAGPGLAITFAKAPKAGQAFFGIAYKKANTPANYGVTDERAIAYAIALGGN